MGLFDDKKYESMDDISKMVEPWENPYDDIICKLPDEWEVPVKIIERCLSCYDPDPIIFKNFMSNFLTPVEASLLIESRILEKEYKNGKYDKGLLNIEVTPGYTFNSLTYEQNGTIKVVKTARCISEETLKKMLLNNFERNVFKSISSDGYKSETLRNLYEVVTSKKYESDNKSKRLLIATVKDELRNLIIEDRWRIRSFNLYNKFFSWCSAYLNHSDSASIANIMKMKIMTYSGRAIYSVGEEK
jgi:uncharacterized protein YfkK (UPF0435 family)